MKKVEGDGAKENEDDETQLSGPGLAAWDRTVSQSSSANAHVGAEMRPSDGCDSERRRGRATANFSSDVEILSEIHSY